MNSNELKIVGLVIVIIDIVIALILPKTYLNLMERMYRDDITTTQATVMSVSSTSEYHRGGKGSRGTTHYIYRIVATSDGKVMDLIEHDITQKNLQIEKSDVITVYCLNDKYAYAPEDFYVMKDSLKILMFCPMFIGVGLVMFGLVLGKKE